LSGSDIPEQLNVSYALRLTFDTLSVNEYTEHEARK